MVATNAFGMGIDKSNVGFVIHYNMPKDLESYYQEAGRAGRDGSPADCILLFAAGDIKTARFMIESTDNNEKLTAAEQEKVRQRDLQRLTRMTDYCRTSGCLRAFLLRYFGEEAPDQCGNCGSCLGETVEEDITVPAQKILSCVIRAERQLGYSLGRSTYFLILKGSGEQRILDKGLDALSTYGILNEPLDRLQGYFNALEAQGYLRYEPEHSTITITPAAREVLFQGRKVRMRRRLEEHRPSASPLPVDQPLMDRLKKLRLRLAQKGGVPAYAVFPDTTLRAMSAAKPQTDEAFRQLPGVGETKLHRFGPVFMEEIAAYLKENPS